MACVTAIRSPIVQPLLSKPRSRVLVALAKMAKRRQMLGAYLLSSGVYEQYYYRAQQVRTLITEDYRRAYEQCDVILMPASPRTAFRGSVRFLIPPRCTPRTCLPSRATLQETVVFLSQWDLAPDSGICRVPAPDRQGPAFKDRSLLTFARALERSVGASPVAPAFVGRGGELQ